jgi:hypothetical protein
MTVPTLREWLESIIAQAEALKAKLVGAPEDDVSKALQEIDANLSSLLSWAEDGWKED